MEDDMGFGVLIMLRCLVGWVRGWGAWDGGAGAEGSVSHSGVEVVGVICIKAVADGEPGYGGGDKVVREGCRGYHSG